MFSDDGSRVALIQKDRPEWQRGLLNGVGGKLEAGECPDEAIAREFLEETGVSTRPSDWRTFAVLKRLPDYEVYFMKTHNAEVVRVRTQETEVVGVFDPYALPKHVIFNLRWLIPMALDPAMLSKRPVVFSEEPRDRRA